MTDRIGQQVGNYRLTRLLGCGSFAEVYLGEHVLLRSMVAIKLLYTRVAGEDVTQFLQEAQLQVGLKHPHIVRMLDFGISEEQTPYLIMDYAPNGNLRARYAKGAQLPVSTVIEYVKQLAEALQYAHDSKIIHRDIKPQNMLIGEKNEILLSDFGVALIMQSSHNKGKKDLAGTIAYMAPEQFEEHPCPASDQYSLGIVAYEWLCGTRPFDGPYFQMALQHKLKPPPSPREYLSTLSPDVERVVLKSLAKQPGERFSSISAFATALEQACGDALLTERLRSRGISSHISLSDAIVSSPITEAVLTPPPGQPAEPSVTYATQPVSVPVSAIQTPPVLPNLPAPEKMTGKRPISRRTLVIGAASLATVTAAGVGIYAIAYATRPVTPLVLTATPQNQPFIYKGHSGTVHGVMWAPDGKRIASASFDKTVKVWNANGGSDVFTYSGHLDRVHRVAWSPVHGTRIASCSADRTVQVWDASDGGNVFKYKGHSDEATRVAWSPDEMWIASGSYDQTVQVWNASNGGNVFTYKGHSGGVLAVVWSLLGEHRIASGSADNTVQIWNANDGGDVFKYTGHSDLVNVVAWSPDGKRIASGSADNTVQIWNASDGGDVFKYTGHNGGVWAVAWSPDGQWIASGSVDKTVQVWDANNGNKVFTYTGHTAQVWSVAWSPDGKRIASCSDDGTVQVWYPR